MEYLLLLFFQTDILAIRGKNFHLNFKVHKKLCRTLNLHLPMYVCNAKMYSTIKKLKQEKVQQVNKKQFCFSVSKTKIKCEIYS